jgi:phosphopantetheinyl transferase
VAGRDGIGALGDAAPNGGKSGGARTGAPLPVCEIWLIGLDQASAALEDEESRHPRLASDEIARGGAIKTLLDRQRWRAAHIALRLAIERASGSAWRGVPYDVAPGGRPSLPASAPHFSLSHSEDVALIAVAQRSVIGADIERIQPRKVSVARRGKVEAFAIDVAGGAPLPEAADARFVQAWCRIEALAKAGGCGIGKVLTRAGLIGAGARQAGATSNLPASFTAGGPASDPTSGSAALKNGGLQQPLNPRFRVWDVPLGEGAGLGFAAALAMPEEAACLGPPLPHIGRDLADLLSRAPAGDASR